MSELRTEYVFQYGSNMSSKRLRDESRIPEAQPIGPPGPTSYLSLLSLFGAESIIAPHLELSPRRTAAVFLERSLRFHAT
jgi:hypothetical protein